MGERRRQTEPQVNATHTGNTDSNAHKLAINDERGFGPTHLTGCGQGGVGGPQTSLA